VCHVRLRLCLARTPNPESCALQKALEGDLAWAIGHDTSADSIRQPLEPVRPGCVWGVFAGFTGQHQQKGITDVGPTS